MEEHFVASAAPQSTVSVRGRVVDANGAAVEGSAVTAKDLATRILRSSSTREDGLYQINNLLPGNYEIAASRPGFKTVWQKITLQVGDQATVNFELPVGTVDERVQINETESALNTVAYTVDSSVNRSQIEYLPLNGRNFLELAQLEPSVKVVSVTNPGGLGNNFQQVLFGGAYFTQTHTSVDGSTIGDRLIGGATQRFSQESVQEFQISTFNHNPATGVAASGAINIITRRGSNDLHGSGFFYYRDNNLAAYPALRRDPVNPSPFFARRQSGFSVGGPLKKEKLFWFTNYEHNNQDAVFSITNNHPIFSKFDGIFTNPFDSDLFNVRLDFNASDKHQTFLRFSLDNNDTLSPAAAVGIPSNWQSIRHRAFQLQGGLISTITPTVVNDLRVSHSYLGGDIDPVTSEQCRDPIPCVGVGGPNIVVFDAPQFRMGSQMNAPFSRWLRTYQVVDQLTWIRGNHRLRLGGEWDHLYTKAALAFLEPAQIVLWGPTNMLTPELLPLFNSLPASLKDPNAPAPTLSEILQLPLRNFTTGIGNASLPGPYNFDEASRTDRFRFYFQDSWTVRPNITVSYGLAYLYDTNLFAHDLDYPAYLAPVLAGVLTPPAEDVNNFDPSLGIAWTIGKSAKTVIRAGGGLYHDESTFVWKARDRAFIGPSGNGRVVVDGSLTGINFTSTPTEFRGQNLIPLLPGIRANLAERFGDGTDLSIRGIEVIKQGDQIVAPDSTTAYSIHLNAGIQRQLRPNLVLTADYVMRRYLHVGALQGVFAIDRNRFNRPRVTGVDQNTGVVSFVRDPVIPLCTPQQAFALNPADMCSTGPINVFSSGANFRYQGLHLTLDRRYENGLQFFLGYAYSRNRGFIDGGFTSFDDYSKAYGTIPDHRRHRLTLSGIWTAPDYQGDSRLRRAIRNSWTVSFISQTFSSPPLNTLLAGLDLDGDGISLTLLPGTNQHNLLGQGLSASELRQLVTQYNLDVEGGTRRVTNPDGSVTLIRPRTPFNQIITPITLPNAFTNGDTFLTQDVRLTRTIKFNEDVKLFLIGEVFNLFNIANLTGYNAFLNQPNYGLPSARTGQVFGSGGPRAFQFAIRLVF